MAVICPICGLPAEGRTISSDLNACQCLNCGEYEISGDAYARCTDKMTDEVRAVLSHAVWNRQGDEKIFRVQAAHIAEAENSSLPTPADQLNSYIKFIGNSQKGSPGSQTLKKWEFLLAKLGALNVHDVQFVEKSAEELRLVTLSLDHDEGGGQLTLAGWQRYEELLRDSSEGNVAFMAMPFGDSEITAMVDDVFKPAVAETGFHLKRLNEEAPAGNIDNRMRVEIRLCKFLIADLTNENRGAYWEAGYAEGLGKPVVYTCSEAYFDEHGTHFDANHYHTIKWDPSEPEKAAEDLKSTIRATLPFEAKMQDDES